MRKLIFVLVAGIGIHHITSYSQTPVSLAEISTPSSTQTAPIVMEGFSDGRFSCDDRQYCSQMHSKEEAQFFLQYCPNAKVDADNDGDACDKDPRWN